MPSILIELRTAALGLLLVLGGCAEDRTAAAIAASAGLQAGAIDAQGFTLALYRRPGPLGPGTVDIYLEGDGTPFIEPDRVAPDPTPRHALALELMALDPGPSLYLGRPCYFGHARDEGCTPALWTDARYGPTVVQAMATALARETPGRSLRLVGYSGGGALAVLLAARLPRTAEIVTIAADLDLAAWTAWHGFSPLDQSIDPATAPPLPPSVRQWHLLAGRDEIVPPGTSERYLARNPLSRVLLWPGFTHGCCWTEIWPSLIAALQTGAEPDCAVLRCRDIPLAYQQ